MSRLVGFVQVRPAWSCVTLLVITAMHCSSVEAFMLGLRIPIPCSSTVAAFGSCSAGVRHQGLRMSAGPFFEKDCVQFVMPSPLKEKYEKPTILGAVLDEGALLVQPLCIREEGSMEFYLDTREEPLNLEEDQILRVVDTYPSQRPVPSLGGGEGYGAEAVDVWEVEEELGEDCEVPLDETGMGFHQKGWA